MRIVLVITCYVISYHLFLISGNVITSFGEGGLRLDPMERVKRTQGEFERFGRLVTLLAHVVKVGTMRRT